MARLFKIGHVTIQVESGGVATCHLAGADAV
jgi:cobalt-zinc-cadmium efflux system protein